jgi:hypothetical protein
MNETDRKLALSLLRAWIGEPSVYPIEYAVNEQPKFALALVNAAREGVTAELAATPMADEDALVESLSYALWQHDCEVEGTSLVKARPHSAYSDEARAALSAIRPTLAALQARAEAAEKERDELRAAIFGSQNYDPCLKHGNFLEMAASTERSRLGAIARAEAAEAENARLRPLWNAPPKHDFWGAGEPDCPREIKARNGELHTLRCKVCGLDNPRDDICRAALGDKS